MNSPRLTAETVNKIDELYVAAAELRARAESYYSCEKYARARRADRASARLQMRAWRLVHATLSPAQGSRMHGVMVAASARREDTHKKAMSARARLSALSAQRSAA